MITPRPPLCTGVLKSGGAGTEASLESAAPLVVSLASLELTPPPVNRTFHSGCCCCTAELGVDACDSPEADGGPDVVPFGVKNLIFNSPVSLYEEASRYCVSSTRMVRV